MAMPGERDLDLLEIPFQALEVEMTRRAVKARSKWAAGKNKKRKEVEEMDKEVDRKAKKSLKKKTGDG